MLPPVSLLVEQPEVGAFNPPKRLLMGPGPGNAHPRVHAAMALPQIGHMDGAFLQMAEEIKEMLSYAWQTKNPFTVPCSGTGSAAWEALCANLTSPGDKHLVLVNGYFGLRHCDMASRYGAEIIKLEKPWGEVFTPEEVDAACAEHKPDMIWVAHAETSTGACQPMDQLGEIARNHDCLLAADTVTTPSPGRARFCVEIIDDLDAIEKCASSADGRRDASTPSMIRRALVIVISAQVRAVDEWGVDAAYAGGQKALSCPPGIAPLTFGDRALTKMDKRTAAGEQVKNWYLDMNMIKQYLVVNDFGVPRVYHHTAPISMAYALREALGILTEEGLEASWSRHRDAAEFFWNELEKIGLECHVDWEHRLPTLTTVKIPEGIDGGKVVTYLKGELQHRDRRRPRGAGGQGLAHRADGLQRAPRERGAGLCCFARRARRRGGYYRAPGLLYPSRQHSRSSFPLRLISPYPGLSCPCMLIVTHPCIC